MEIVESLQQLANTFGTVGAVGIFGWWYERRANRELQRHLLRLASSQIQATSEIKAALVALKEHQRR